MELLEPKAMAEALGISGALLRQLVREGLPCYHMGVGQKRRRLRFDAEQVLAWVRKCKALKHALLGPAARPGLRWTKHGAIRTAVLETFGELANRPQFDAVDVMAEIEAKYGTGRVKLVSVRVCLRRFAGKKVLERVGLGLYRVVVRAPNLSEPTDLPEKA